MTLEQYAYVAEITGVVIVVVTLIYLAVQVRGSAISERSAGHRSFIENFNDSFFGPSKDPAMAKLRLCAN